VTVAAEAGGFGATASFDQEGEQGHHTEQRQDADRDGGAVEPIAAPLGQRRHGLRRRFRLGGVLTLRTQEVVDRFVRIDPDEARIFTQETAGEDRRRQELEAILLEGIEIADADLGGFGDFLQTDVADLALPAEPRAERNRIGFSALLPRTRQAVRSLGRLAHGALNSRAGFRGPLDRDVAMASMSESTAAALIA
jgi:hypothetical protein